KSERFFNQRLGLVDVLAVLGVCVPHAVKGVGVLWGYLDELLHGLDRFIPIVVEVVRFPEWVVYGFAFVVSYEELFVKIDGVLVAAHLSVDASKVINYDFVLRLALVGLLHQAERFG